MNNCSAYVPSYWVTFEFEKEFDYASKIKFMRNNPMIPYVSSAIYLILVFGLRHLMKNREPLKLNRLLATWSAGLAIFSITGFVRTIPELVHVLSNFEFKESICTESYTTGVFGFWTWAFILSKWPELGDTLFIVLRKQKLIFLHWFHHLSVLILVWYSNSFEFSFGRWFMTMNFGVHSIMYTYFALRAMGYKLPKSMAMSITVSQLLQMAVGIYVTSYAYLEQKEGRSCSTNPNTIYMSLALYGAYLFLFGNFFLHSYLAFLFNDKPKRGPLLKTIESLKDMYQKEKQRRNDESNCNNNQDTLEKKEL
jgi:elongation of very long chain fatty acids protein 6